MGMTVYSKNTKIIAMNGGFVSNAVCDNCTAVIPAEDGLKEKLEAAFANTKLQEYKVTEENGVQVGTPIAASSDANLVDLGVFKITHYCPCSICCGPYANGITSTGVTATTNHTIAVDPSVIPYGSKVVINGQVYVAEDCGGAIKNKRIDIYVATHAEGEAKGTYDTEVYLLK